MDEQWPTAAVLQARLASIGEVIDCAERHPEGEEWHHIRVEAQSLRYEMAAIRALVLLARAYDQRCAELEWATDEPCPRGAAKEWASVTLPGEDTEAQRAVDAMMRRHGHRPRLSVPIGGEDTVPVDDNDCDKEDSDG